MERDGLRALKVLAALLAAECVGIAGAPVRAQTACIPPASWMSPAMAWYNARACEQAAREQAAAQAQAQRDAAEQAKRQAAQREQQRVARAEAEAAQRKAEESPENICRGIAGVLLSDFGELPTMKERNIEAVDIEHLITVRYDAEHSVMMCHGRFVLNRGAPLTGTMTFKLNVAGDLICSGEVVPVPTTSGLSCTNASN
jgi:hypothetical protein